MVAFLNTLVAALLFLVAVFALLFLVGEFAQTEHTLGIMLIGMLCLGASLAASIALAMASAREAGKRGLHHYPSEKAMATRTIGIWFVLAVLCSLWVFSIYPPALRDSTEETLLRISLFFVGLSSWAGTGTCVGLFFQYKTVRHSLRRKMADTLHSLSAHERLALAYKMRSTGRTLPGTPDGS